MRISPIHSAFLQLAIGNGPLFRAPSLCTNHPPASIHPHPSVRLSSLCPSARQFRSQRASISNSASNESMQLSFKGSKANTAAFAVHPVVILSILDHHKRRNEDQYRVIGTLLGVRDTKGRIVVKNSFPIPHTEKDGAVVLDLDYQKTMTDLLAKVSHKEQVVGWSVCISHVRYHPCAKTPPLPHPKKGIAQAPRSLPRMQRSTSSLRKHPRIPFFSLLTPL